MISKTIQRRFFIGVVFIILSMIHFFGSGKPVVFAYAIILAAVTIGIEMLVFSRRGAFLFSIIGLIAGFYSGKLLFELLQMIIPGILNEAAEPYFILGFTYLGFMMPFLSPQKNNLISGLPFSGDTEKRAVDTKILDTSVIIDGRIADIGETGFLSGTLVLPKFVLNEIQSLADSKDPIKRSRARRGLDILNKLKEIHTLDLKISSRDFTDIKGVDAKLIALAKELSASIITNDYNLNKIAKLDGILILNLNDLSNALKSANLPGEEMELEVLKEGKENNQGVGYLEDGTMVVVANGLHLIGKKVHVKVTSILQTSSGRIIFTEPKR